MLKDTLEKGRIVNGRGAGTPASAGNQYPASIHQAMRHSVFAGGKRLRPILCMEAGANGGRLRSARASRSWARRWRCCTPTRSSMTICPRSITTTCGAAFLPATRLLAKPRPSWPAMLCKPTPTRCWRSCSARRKARVAIIGEVAHATGTIDGMIGGQVMDLEAEHTKPDAQDAGVYSSLQDGRAADASVVTGGMYAESQRAQIAQPARFRPEHRAGVSDRGRRARRYPDFGAIRQDRRQRHCHREGDVSRVVWDRCSLKKADELVAKADAALASFGEAAATCARSRSFWWRGKSNWSGVLWLQCFLLQRLLDDLQVPIQRAARQHLQSSIKCSQFPVFLNG